jgi:hypothetical protein
LKTRWISALLAGLIGFWAGAASSDEFRPGGYLTFGGLLGLSDRSPNVGFYTYDSNRPATATTPFTWENGLDRNREVLGFSGKAGWDFETASDLRFRVGGGYTSLTGQSSENNLPVYAIVHSFPTLAGSNKPLQGAIRICEYPESCAEFTGDVERKYRETMLALYAGTEDAHGATWWFGIEPFRGRIDEASRYNTSITLYNGQSIDEYSPLDSQMSADLSGATLSVRREGMLTEDWGYSINLGLGSYSGDATNSVSAVQSGATATDILEFNGIRAQLGAGLDYRLSDNVSLGINGKIDFWSDQPYTYMEWDFEPGSTPTIAEPPRGLGDYGIRMKEHVSLSLEISLTFRM